MRTIIKLVFTCSVIALGFAGPGAAVAATRAPSASGTAAQNQLERNRLAARRFLEALYTVNNNKAGTFLADSYREHQASAGFSRSGLFGYARDRAAANPQHYLVIHRTIAQGDLVFLHVEQRLTAHQSVARGELFRFLPDGRIAEHWSAQQDVPATDANGNGMFRGSEVNRAAKAGREFGAAIMENDAIVFRTLNPDLVARTRTSRYLQHNPNVNNGPAGLQAFITMMRDDHVIVEARVIKVVAEGDYVAALNYFKTDPQVPGFGESVVFDVVRVTDAGKVDEHWDVVEDAPGIDQKRAF
ncbi:MAG: hypothetical protein ABIQ66_08550 [Novosphingobium sp.]